MEESTEPDKQGLKHLSSFGRLYFKLIEFDPDEKLLLEIRKHPIGLSFIYIIGGFIAVTIFAVVTALASSGFFSEIGLEGYESIVVFFGFLLSVFVIVVSYINGYLYKHNVIFITNEKIAQVVNISLFHRKVSQLSIGDTQDVSVAQKTFLARAFNYGTLIIETAGEQQNYTFNYVPNPFVASKVIINAHEENLKHYGN
ncbi:MAG TPA: PH domain-containing protein [Candidatus Saccharibacteria bacterium]|nr:PH domain-containing protein [Candidatus Saccharibacteria bacterium]